MSPLRSNINNIIINIVIIMIIIGSSDYSCSSVFEAFARKLRNATVDWHAAAPGASAAFNMCNSKNLFIFPNLSVEGHSGCHT